MVVVLGVMRAFILPVDESPKFLVAKGRDRDAVDVIHHVAKKNKTQSTLTLEKLRASVAE